jgi:hypothetical protein
MKSLADMTELESLSYVGKSMQYRLSKTPTPRMVEVVLVNIVRQTVTRTRRGKTVQLPKCWAIVRPAGSTDCWQPVNCQRLFPYDVPTCLRYRSPTYQSGITHLVRRNEQ